MVFRLLMQKSFVLLTSIISTMKYLLTLIAIVIAFSGIAQLSPQAKVYLLTCDPGQEIYTQFGHSAIRITDKQADIDLCFNWGMFEFDEDEFEFNMKFARGKLPYYMDIQTFPGFMAEYQYFQRTVRQCELNLTQEQKNELWLALQENYKPENRTYAYDFFFDNCASRIRDFFVRILGENLIFGKHPFAEKRTYRSIVNEFITSHPWTLFGINLVLGSRIDIPVSNENLMFLPVYMEEIFKTSTTLINGKEEPFVIHHVVLLQGETDKTTQTGILSPTLLTWGIFGLILFLMFAKMRRALSVLGTVLFFSAGVLGIALLLMWIATDHQATKVNFNLLWANPLFVFIPLLTGFKRIFVRLHLFFRGLTIYFLAIILLWIILPQDFDFATKGLMLSLGLIAYTWSKNSADHKKTT
jgi:hypothetical protein